jgi:alpha-tubulin suppressor-like RCC1 family protein
MHLLAEHHRWRGLVPLAVLAGILAIAASASAAPAGVVAWGDNRYGQLGDGTTTGAELPVAVSALSGVTAVSAGGEHGLALLSDGTVMAWGENEKGELGDGTTGGVSEVPVAVSGLSGVTAISAGTRYSLALLGNGTVMAWGDNAGGELGDGTTGGVSNVPVAVSGLSGVTAISAGRGNNYYGEVHSLARLSNGTVMAWGFDGHGELGNGTTGKSSNVPVAVTGLTGVASISAGNGYSLAALESGTAVAWGANALGQLGDGAFADTNLPVAVSGLSGVTAISAASAHSLALLSSGSVMAWGENFDGQLGNGSDCDFFNGSCPSDVPIPVSGLSGVTAIAAGGTGVPNQGGYSNEENEHSLALLRDGTVVAWGSNLFGQLGVLGRGGEPGLKVDVATPVAGLSVVIGISGGGVFSLAFGPPIPGVFGVAPNQGPESGGTSVTITGVDFTAATAVDFGATSATSFTVNSDGSITAIAPAQTASTVDVTVTAPAGTSAATSADRFSYGVPTVAKLKPTKGPVGGGTTVTITGTNLTHVTAVRFGSANATSFALKSSTSLTAIAPAEAAGEVNVTVTTPGGTSAISSADHFTFLPTVTGVSPNLGPKAGGTSVMVTGAGFALGTTATKFKFGSVVAKSVNCTSTTTCTVVSPPHEVGTVDVKAIVKNAGSAKNAPADQFTYS